jgi:hypothetical protein
LLKCGDGDLLVSPEIMASFERMKYLNTFLKHQRRKELTEILSFFGRRQIDVMLIKGAALDLLVYDHPWYMVSDDIDLVMRCRRQELSDQDHEEIMRSLGSGIECEYFCHHDVDLNGALPINFQRVWDDASSVELDGSPVWIMSPEDMLISACTNSCRKRYFRLKLLCDIREIVNKCPDLKWGALIRKAREDGCDTIVFTALMVTKMTLGCELPENVLDDLAVSPIRATIIRSLIRHMSQCVPLSSLYSSLGKNWRPRQATVSLILPYISSRWYQVWRRIKFSLISRLS